MKEIYIVTRIIIDIATDLEGHTFIIYNPKGKDQPPTFDTYNEAQEWIKNKGQKHKYYQIQKIFISS